MSHHKNLLYIEFDDESWWERAFVTVRSPMEILVSVDRLKEQSMIRLGML